MTRRCALLGGAGLVVLGFLSGCGPSPDVAVCDPLSLVVMDPLALPLSCECVEGYAQRRYERLAAFLERRLNRPVEVAFSSDLTQVIRTGRATPGLIIGKHSVVRFDAAESGLNVRPIARLTDRGGGTDFCGLFVVRQDDPAKDLADLKGYRIQFGPEESDEKHSAAMASLRAGGVPVPDSVRISAGCVAATLAVIEKQADAAVISSYCLPLLEGCGSVEKGELRVVARTSPVPFVTVFATETVGLEDRKAILEALLAVREEKELLRALETRDGFVPAGPEGQVHD